MGNDEDTCRSNKRAKSSSSSSRKRCEDCGNKAKRDCEHKRCRTCCQNKGFRCETHVKSTWVPLSKRHRQQIFSAYTVHQQRNNGPISPRRYRSEQNPETSLGHHFPGEVSFPAVFRCIRLRSMDNNALDDEYCYAYGASVNIGNRVFSGILYDQGRHRSYYNEEETANLVTNANNDFLQHNPNLVMGSTSDNNHNICAATGNYNNTQYSNSHCCYALNNYSSAVAAAASQFL